MGEVEKGGEGSWQLGFGFGIGLFGLVSASLVTRHLFFTLIRSAGCWVLTAKQIGPMHLATRKSKKKPNPATASLQPTATDGDSSS